MFSHGSIGSPPISTLKMNSQPTPAWFDGLFEALGKKRAIAGGRRIFDTSGAKYQYPMGRALV
jgi:hypothetical protein